MNNPQWQRAVAREGRDEIDRRQSRRRTAASCRVSPRLLARIRRAVRTATHRRRGRYAVTPTNVAQFFHPMDVSKRAIWTAAFRCRQRRWLTPFSDEGCGWSRSGSAANAPGMIALVADNRRDANASPRAGEILAGTATTTGRARHGGPRPRWRQTPAWSAQPSLPGRVLCAPGRWPRLGAA